MNDDDRTLGDDALRARLRAADPADALAPLPPTWLDHRMEQLMTDTTTTPAAPEAATPARPRIPRWMPLAGAAAAVAIAAAIVAPLALGGTQPSVEQLAAPEGGGLASGSCLALDSATIAAQDQAFAATVLEVGDGTVLLEVTDVFAGEVADRVEVTQVDAASSDFSGVPFEVGADYLVGALDGTVTGCGVSGADSPELRAFYDEAFGG